MLLATAVCLLALGAVLFTVYREGRSDVAAVPEEPPTGLPTLAQVRWPALPVRWRGYDRAAVHAHLDRVADAYAQLSAAAPEDSRAANDSCVPGHDGSPQARVDDVPGSCPRPDMLPRERGSE